MFVGGNDARLPTWPEPSVKNRQSLQMGYSALKTWVYMLVSVPHPWHDAQVLQCARDKDVVSDMSHTRLKSSKRSTCCHARSS